MPLLSLGSMRHLMGNDVIGLGEVNKDVPIAVTVGHLASIPESVVIVHAIMDGRQERLSRVIHRISAEQHRVARGLSRDFVRAARWREHGESQLDAGSEE